jgi:6-phosphogluconolactonase (cycloisomerase 2 family)
MSTFFVGTYPPKGFGTPVGHGEGVWRATIGADGLVEASHIAAEPAPSFVVAHPRQALLYAVEEADPTSLVVWDVSESAREVARVDVGGAYGCHVLIAPDAATLYVCHYGTGEVSVIPLAADGTPRSTTPAQTLSHTGSGPRPDRQEGPHAHSAAFAPGGRHLVVADLGTDELRRYTIGDDGRLDDAGIATTLPPGSGPRHVAVRGELLYVVCELDHQLRTLRWDRASATAEVIAERPTTLVPQRTGDAVYDAHVDLVHRAAGDMLLVSVRGADVISVFDVAPEGELTYRAAIDAGYWPRHFAVVGEHLVVGAERGHEIRAYELADVVALPPESESGAVASLPYRSAKVASPACIVPA